MSLEEYYINIPTFEIKLDSLDIISFLNHLIEDGFDYKIHLQKNTDVRRINLSLNNINLVLNSDVAKFIRKLVKQAYSEVSTNKVKNNDILYYLYSTGGKDEILKYFNPSPKYHFPSLIPS